MTLRRLALPLALLMAALFEHRPAEAALPNPSCSVRVHGSQFDPIPRNARALVVTRNDDRATSTFSARLTAPDGATAPLPALVADAHGLLTLPLPSLQLGTSVIDTLVECNGGAANPAPTGQQKQPVAEEVPFPTTIGAFEPQPLLDARARNFVLRPSPELKAHILTSVVRLTVNDDRRPGLPTDTVGGFSYDRTTESGDYELTAFFDSACRRGGEYLDGKQTARIKLEAFIAGVDQAPPPITLEETVDCNQVIPEDQRYETSGCSMSHRPTADHTWLLVGIATVAARLTRRKKP